MAKKESKHEERVQKAEMKAGFGKRAIISFFDTFGVHHREFMRELSDRAKVRGLFPYLPERVLALSYSDPDDMAVAACMGTLIWNGRYAERSVREFRSMMGDSPMRWICNRDFVSLAVSGGLGQSTGLTSHSRIMEFANELYDLCHVGMNETVVMRLNTCELNKRLLLLILGTSDGLGTGVWDLPPHLVLCPDGHDVRVFMKMWIPEFSVHGGNRYDLWFDESVKLFGFERDSDFFYSYYGWEELCRRKPKECSRYATQYLWRYTNGAMMSRCYWFGKRHGMIPEIDF